MKLLDNYLISIEMNQDKINESRLRFVETIQAYLNYEKPEEDDLKTYGENLEDGFLQVEFTYQ